MARWIATLALVSASLAGTLALAGCGGPTRSVTAYCSFFYGRGGQLQQRWAKVGNSAAQNPIGALGTVFAELPEAANFLHELSERAPAEIAPDVETLAHALKQVSEQAGTSLSDPLGALASGLMDGIETSGAEQQVNAYTEQHCGGPP